MHNLNSLETFIRVVEANSFTKAAGLRNISRAAVSKQINQLEADLGVTLLLRTTREIVLTSEGQLVYEEGRRILENVIEVEAMLSGLKEEATGQLNIISGPVFAHKYIFPNLQKFFKKHPKINLKIDLRHLMPNMIEEKIDVVAGVFGGGPPDAIQRTAFMTRRLFCASPAYLKGKGKLKKPEDLATHTLFAHPVSPNDPHILLKGGKHFNMQPKLILNDQMTLKTCAMEGLGIAYIQHHVVEKELLSKELVEVLSDYSEQENTIPINLYYFKRKYLHSKVRAFIDYIMSNIPSR